MDNAKPRTILIACALSCIQMLAVDWISAQVNGAASSADSVAQTKKPVTVRTAIERVQFQYEGSRIYFSPDGKRFAVVVERGDLTSDATRADILVFDIDAATSYVKGNGPTPTARNIATFRSTSNRRAVTELRWADQGQSIVFLGENAGELPQLRKYDFVTHRLTQLSNEPTGVWAYGYDGGNAVISVHVPPNTTPVRSRKSMVIRNEGLRDLLDMAPPDPEQFGEYRVRFRFGDNAWKDLSEARTQMIGTFQNAWMSPDGRYAVTLRRATRIPESWRAHGQRSDRPAFAPTENPDDVSLFVMRWILIDLRTGDTRILVDSPIGFGLSTFAGWRSAFWRADSRNVILSDVLVPVDAAGAHAALPKDQPYFVEFDVESGKWKTLAAFPRRNAQGSFPTSVMTTRWDSTRDRLCVQMRWNNSDFPVFTFERSPDGRWTEREKPPTPGSPYTLQPDEPMTFEVRQDLNDPPVLVGKDNATGREAVILDPNPEFKHMTFGKASIVEFKDSTGRAWRGGLVLPVGYEQGKRYPLVIQTHGFSARTFLMQGNGTTGYAAQALANRGFVVIQLQNHSDMHGKPEEPAIYAAGYEALIEKLDNDGLIDKNRVGIMGFSRTCFHVRNALVNSKAKFAAAVVHDGVDFGYVSYVLGYNYIPGMSGARDQMYQQMWGAAPVEDGITVWKERVPSFNLHRVQAPLMIEAIAQPLFEWEWYVGLKRLGKPVEMRYIPGGSHELFRPQDQYFSQQGNVDWFAFWLKGEEDADPAKKDQYARWRELRKRQTNVTPNKDPLD